MENRHSFYILTDTHYVSKRAFEPGSRSFRRREAGDQIALVSSVEILRSSFDVILADDEADAVLITGDLVNSGDKLSHEDFIKELRVLTDAGKRVFVTTATHDYCGMGDDENFFTASRYTLDGTEPAEPVRKAELPGLYADFGPNQSDSVDPESGSYSLKLYDGVRLIALNDNGNGRSHCGLFDEGCQWLEHPIDAAHAAGESVLLAVHHPVIPPWDVYAQAVDFEMFGGYRRLKELMCEKGVRVVFTGHTHVQNIRRYDDEAGRYFYDVATTAAVSAAGNMRRVTVDTAEKTCAVDTVRIDAIKGWDTGSKSFSDYIYGLNFVGLLEKALPLAETDWPRFVETAGCVLPADKLKEHERLVKTALKKLQKLKVRTVAKFGGRLGGVTKEDLSSLGDERVLPVLFTIGRHIQSGNAPYGPETPEYKVIKGAVLKGGKLVNTFKKDLLDSIVPPGQTLWDVAEPFVCNNRTGDDDRIVIEL